MESIGSIINARPTLEPRKKKTLETHLRTSFSVNGVNAGGYTGNCGDGMFQVPGARKSVNDWLVDRLGENEEKRGGLGNLLGWVASNVALSESIISDNVGESGAGCPLMFPCGLFGTLG